MWWVWQELRKASERHSLGGFGMRKNLVGVRDGVGRGLGPKMEERSRMVCLGVFKALS